jgi:hypothetical protein
MLAFLLIKIFSQDVFYSVHFKRKRGATVSSKKETPVPYRSIPLTTVAYHPLSPFAVHHWTIQNITETIHEHFIELGIVLNDADLFWMVTTNVWI